MGDHNINNVSLPEINFDTLYREFVKRYEREQEDKHLGTSLPLEIVATLENSSEQQLEYNIKQFRRDTTKYVLDKLTTPERINPELYKEINKHKVDTTDVISKIYDFTETTRFQAKVAAEIFEQLEYVIQSSNNIEETKRILQRIYEQNKRLAIIGLHHSKTQERTARNYEY